MLRHAAVGMFSLAAAVYVWLKGGQKAEAYSCPSVLLAQGVETSCELWFYDFHCTEVAVVRLESPGFKEW